MSRRRAPTVPAPETPRAKRRREERLAAAAQKPSRERFAADQNWPDEPA